MEALLQLMLNWDPVQRGGRVSPDTKKPFCFEVLEQILSMKASCNLSTVRVSLSEPHDPLNFESLEAVVGKSPPDLVSAVTSTASRRFQRQQRPQSE